ncbi:MAG TPA: pyridoxamine 5'-phosphate oxidase family protein [Vicinamibacteria bacterium]|nr:pyridoxamine 5'-phosphate oxidase family protein [Vicinamibacteria bacterium]
MQRRAGVLQEAQATGRIINAQLPAGAERFLSRQRLAVTSSLEPSGRVWASLLTGHAGFIAAVDPRLLLLAVHPSDADPLAFTLAARPELGLLVLDPATRQRMRFNGRGLLSPEGVFLRVDQVYGNCPKYIQKRRLEGDDLRGAQGPTRVMASLDALQQAAIERADTLFIASFHPQGGADASHRGGLPGFVQVLAPDRLAFDDYPGNGMFNTLGNLAEYPQAGLLFVDFVTGDLLQATGRADVGPAFSVTFRIDEVRATPGGCPLRYEFVEYSPANPPLSHEVPAGISRRKPDAQSERSSR